jgi:hypothetical protein
MLQLAQLHPALKATINEQAYESNQVDMHSAL